jgi:plasmid maintenance system antidote protein VapI
MGKSGGGEFDRLLDRAEKLLGQKQKVAEAIGIKPPRYSRLRAGTDGYSLNVRNCFRLAALLGETPQRVLRAADKLDLADALDDFYGAGSVPVTDGLEWIDSVSVGDVATVVKAMTQLPEHAQAALAQAAEVMLKLQAGTPGASPTSEFVPAAAPVTGTNRAPKKRR